MLFSVAEASPRENAVLFWLASLEGDGGSEVEPRGSVGDGRGSRGQPVTAGAFTCSAAEAGRDIGKISSSALYPCK